ncbi:MAG: hypothetical protein OHK0039_46090 [Bacteroidia bacterium]
MGGEGGVRGLYPYVRIAQHNPLACTTSNEADLPTITYAGSATCTWVPAPGLLSIQSRPC